MTAPAQNTIADDIILIALPEQPLAGDIADYLNHLAAQHVAAPLTLTIKIHPLNIAEGLAHEFAAQKRRLGTSEKNAAHECGDPWHPLENAVVRHELCNLIAEMTAPIAEATLGHHLLFLIVIGRNLPPLYAADDHLALCASFDSKRGGMRQRFAPQREIAPPPNEARIASGMTLVCEPMETGYYRIPDDERHRSASGLLMGDNLYHWTLQAVLAYHLMLANYFKLTPEERETVMLQQTRQLRSLFRLLALSHPETTSYASLGGLNWVLLQAGLDIHGMLEGPSPEETSAEEAPLSKFVRGRFAGPMGSVNAHNIEHQAAAHMLERNLEQLHHLHQPHAHAENIEPQPE